MYTENYKRLLSKLKEPQIILHLWFERFKIDRHTKLMELLIQNNLFCKMLHFMSLFLLLLLSLLLLLLFLWAHQIPLEPTMHEWPGKPTGPWNLCDVTSPEEC